MTLVDRHCFDADLNPNFLLDGDPDPDPDPDWHQNDSDPPIVFSLSPAILYLHILISFSLPYSPLCTVHSRFPFFFLLVAWLTILVLFFRSHICLSNDIHDG